MRSRDAWAWHIALVACLGLAFLASGPSAAPLFYSAAPVAGLAAALLGARRVPPERRRPLRWLAAALFANVVADTIFSCWQLVTGSEVPDVSVADVAYLSSYPLFAYGVITMARARAGQRDWAAMIDATIVAVGAGVAFWQFVMAPLAADTTQTMLARVVNVAYPAGDLMLLAALLRLVLAGGRRCPALGLLAAGTASTLVGDVLYLVLSATGGYQDGGLVDLFWMGFPMLVGAALLHPSVARLCSTGEPVQEGLRWGRLALLTVSALVAPAVALVAGGGVAPAPIGASAVLFVLVMTRVAGLLRTLERSGERRFQSLVQRAADFCSSSTPRAGSPTPAPPPSGSCASARRTRRSGGSTRTSGRPSRARSPPWRPKAARPTSRRGCASPTASGAPRRSRSPTCSTTPTWPAWWPTPATCTSCACSPPSTA
ncbi:MAG: hypothetical protein ACKVWR_21595 [Acidimicrobiales bacterium]